MSHVTDILLCTSIDDGGISQDEHPNFHLFNDWLIGRYKRPIIFKQINQFAGGGKAMQCDVFCAAINFCDIPELVEHFRLINWEHPECAQLFIKDENDDKFVVFNAMI